MREAIWPEICTFCNSLYAPRFLVGGTPMSLAPQLDGPRLKILNDRVIVEINWDDADALRDHFLRHGLPGTVKLDPATREAAIELWDEPDPQQVRTALDEWLA
jgi:hypothetical protein